MLRRAGLVLMLFIPFCDATPAHAQKSTRKTTAERGQIVARAVPSGGYFCYLPRREVVNLLVVAHGQPAGRDVQDIPGLARRFAERWMPFAEDHGLVLLAPIFDNENFDSVDGSHGGGYRNLNGRQVAADRYVEGIVEQARDLLPAAWDRRFILYGHSAVGQFASRYAVRHPDRIRALLVSAAGQYAMPDPLVAWPNGMAPLRRTVRWPTGESQAIRVQPDPSGWRRAATAFPTTVVVGGNDTEPQTPRDGHTSLRRLDRAAQWVADMDRLAERQKEVGQLKLVVVPGIGHDSAGLTPAAQRALDEALRAPESPTTPAARPKR